MNRQDSITDILRTYFQRFAEHFKVQTVFLYGSWARGLPRNDSDIDVAVAFDDDPSDKELFERVTRFSLSLSEAIGLEVNVIPIYSDFRKPILYYNAIVMGMPIYIKDSMKYVSLINKAIYQAEDFEIFGSGWQRFLTKRNLEAIHHA